MAAVMNVSATPLPGVLIAESSVRIDERGEFSRLFCEKELASCLRERRVVQINRSLSRRVGAVRGMHYQRPPSAEMKIVRCLAGRVWDVALDLRRNSPTFLRWFGVELSRSNNLMVLIPEGCAHGFQVLEPDSELLYLHTHAYDPAADAGVSVRDPRVAVNWPLAIEQLSARDESHPFLTDDFAGIDT